MDRQRSSYNNNNYNNDHGRSEKFNKAPSPSSSHKSKEEWASEISGSGE